ncbi:ThiF family adenylyltransferase [Niallia taxi]|uniref:ThiF family adenylyltransferase n=1 Tax=Niallia taxi TaxID=2499688 RepID=UPI0028707BB7|nr:ThiF family adenylyltransferase [Niallia taxi]
MTSNKLRLVIVLWRTKMTTKIDVFKHIKYDTNYFVSKRTLYPYIVQIGTGGNGTYILQQLAQMLASFNLPHSYIACDPDICEAKNLRNQLFIEADVGKKKADVLARRYSAHYKLNIASYSNQFVENMETLKNLFSNTDHTPVGYNDIVHLPILIGAVDNNYSRRIMHEYFKQADNLLYLDCGIEGVSLVDNASSEEELEKSRNSGYTGQVVAGLKLNGKTLLEPVASVFPDILDDQDEIAPSELSCSTVVASEPQRVITNRFAAMALCSFLNELFETHSITKHQVLFHAKKSYMRAKPIPSE